MARRSSPSDLDEFYIESRSRRFGRRMFKRIRRFIALLVFLVILAVIFAPTVLSSDLARSRLLTVVNDYIPGSISVESLYLSWFGTQSAGGVELRGADQRLVMRIGELRLEQGLFKTVTSKRSIGQVRVIAPVASLVFDEFGGSNLESALGWEHDEVLEMAQESTGSSVDRTAVKVRLPLTGRLLIESGQLTLIQSGLPKTTFSGVGATLQFSHHTGPLVLSLLGDTSQGDLGGSFDINVVASGFNKDGEFQILKNTSGLYKTELGSEIDVRARLSNLPLESIDEIFTRNTSYRKGILTKGLGKTMGMDVLASIDSENIEIDLDAASPTLRAILKGETKGGVFELTEEGSLSIDVTPSFFDEIGELFRVPETLRLRETSKLLFEVKTLRLPMEGGALDIPGLAFDAQVAFEDTQLVGDAAFGELKFINTRASIQTNALHEDVLIAFSSNLVHNTNPSTITAHTRLLNLMDRAGALSLDDLRGDVSVLAQGVSVPVLDEWIGFQGVLVEALGDKLDLTVETDIQGQQGIVTLGVVAGDFVLEDAKLLVGERIVLAAPVASKYTLSAALANRFFSEHWNLRLTQDIPLKATVRGFSFPRPGRNRKPIALNEVSLEGNFQAVEAHLEGIPEIEGALLQNIDLELIGSTLMESMAYFSADMRPDAQENWIVRLGGDTFNVAGVSNFVESKAGGVDFIDTSLDVTSEKIKFKIRADLEDYDFLSVRTPIEFKLSVSDEHVKSSGIDVAGLPQISQPSPMLLTLQPFETSISDYRLFDHYLEGTVDFGHLALQFPDVDYISTLKQGMLKWRFLGPDNALQVDLDAQAEVLNQGIQESGSFDLTLVASRLFSEQGSIDLAQAQAVLKVNADNVPVPFVEAVTRQAGLKDFFGASMDGTLNMKMATMSPFTGLVAGRLKGEAIKVEGAVMVDNTIQLLHTDLPIQVLWKISPERYHLVRKLAAVLGVGAEDAIKELQLIDNTEFTLRCTKLSIPNKWNPRNVEKARGAADKKKTSRMDSDVGDVALDLDFAFENLSLRAPKSGQTLRIDELKAFFAMHDVNKGLAFGINAVGALQGGGLKNQKSMVTLKGRVEDLIEERGDAVQWKTISPHLWLTIDNLPVPLLGDFFILPTKLRDRLHALFGDTLSSSMELELDRMSGPVKVKLNSTNTKGQITGELIEGVLHLKEDAELTVKVTPETGEEILRYFNPLMISAMSAKEPIGLRIGAADFKLPLVPLDLGRAQFSEAILHVDRVQVRNQGPVGDLVRLLRLTKYTSQGELGVWFTPTYLTMSEGRITMRRMDFLVANHFHMASWGYLDIANDRMKVIAGISSETLRSAFKIKGLADAYMLQIPVEGTFDHPKVNMVKAGAKVGALYIQAYGGDKTRLFGGIIQEYSEDEEYGTVPTANTDPLPWRHRDPTKIGEQDFELDPKHPRNEHSEIHDQYELEDKRKEVKHNRRKLEIFLDQLNR